MPQFCRVLVSNDTNYCFIVLFKKQGMEISKRCSNISWMCRVSPNIVAAKAIASASEVDLATEVCFLDCQCSGKNAGPVCIPTTMPLVDLAVQGHDAKSESLHARRIGPWLYETLPQHLCECVCDVYMTPAYGAVGHPNDSNERPWQLVGKR